MTQRGTFLGVEAEGRLRGVPTVFVPGPGIDEALLAGETHVYLGAGGPVGPEGLARLADLLRQGLVRAQVSIEHPGPEADALPAEVLARCRVLLSWPSSAALVDAADLELKLDAKVRAAVFGLQHRVDLTYYHDHPRRPLVVGEAPGRDGVHGSPGSYTVRRLEALLGLQHGDMHAHVDWINLLPAFPGAAEGEGAKFDAKAARAGAAAVRAAASGRRLVLVLGTRAAGVLFGRALRPLDWAVLEGAPTLVLPHPSGASRWWNDKANRAQAVAAVAALGLPRAPLS